MLEHLNNRPFRGRLGSRIYLYECVDKPALKYLLPSAYECLEVKTTRVYLDYYVEYDGHFYSVPYQMVDQSVVIHASQTTVTVSHQDSQAAHHPRLFNHGHTTGKNHMAKAHLKYQERSLLRFVSWECSIDECTTLVVEYSLAGPRHPECGYRAFLGLLNLTKKYG